jgi:biopolymer transport protein ExbD
MFIENTRHIEGEIPTSSLADIVFLLLIFFLVTTSIDIEKGIVLTLPPFQAEPQPIPNMSSIWINAAGQIAFDGEIIPMHQLKGRLMDKLADNPGIIVSLKSDARTDYDIYVKVLDRLKQAWGNKAARISIAEPFEEH